MTTGGETQAQAISEILTWLEQQMRQAREEQGRSAMSLEELRRQVHEVVQDVATMERAIREVEPRFIPFKGIPEKIRGLDESTEHIRQDVAANHAEILAALRIVRAEADYDREERGETSKRIEAAASQLGLVLADIAQVQSQTAQMSQTFQTVLERQREVEARAEQFGLRLDRSIEVNRDLEERIKRILTEDQDDRFDVVFERLQVVGEMVKRNEDVIATVASERSLRQEVLDEISVWRDEHSRIDGRLNALEASVDKLAGQLDKIHGEIALIEGRHAGLGERVAGIRRDVAEVVDQVRAEFAKYNAMTEKQRKKQIQVLEQELREMKFHAFRPPEEP